ncbi:MAG: acetolactate decarboxylase [Mangrovibacterium sp.]
MMEKIKAVIRYLLDSSTIYPAILFLVLSCSKDKEQPQSVVQISTIDALMQGVYDGTTPLSELAAYGDFGIGTFHALDGEMIFLDGVFYQVKADGKIDQPKVNVLTPFATVTFFHPEVNYNVKALSFTQFKSTADSLMVSPNLFHAIKLHGTFSRVKTRSVPAQQKPYRPLVEVTASQPEFETQTVTGTLSGFYCPPFVTGINVPGYHMHFLSDDQNFGGHVLEFEMEEGILWLDQINDFRLILPEEGGFLDTDLTNDLSDDLEEVEGG